MVSKWPQGCFSDGHSVPATSSLLSPCPRSWPPPYWYSMLCLSLRVRLVSLLWIFCFSITIMQDNPTPILAPLNVWFMLIISVTIKKLTLRSPQEPAADHKQSCIAFI